MKQSDIESMMNELFDALQAYTREEGLESTVQVSMNGNNKIFVQFNQTAFFEGNEFALTDEAKEILTKVCEMLDQVADAIDEVRFQGHTAQPYNEPNEPRGDRFLASNRATNVLVFVQTHSSIHPSRLVSEGYGQWRPIGDNDTNEGLTMNRRVEMIISGRDLENDELSQTIQQYFTDADSQTH